jgi:hypothetical protein
VLLESALVVDGTVARQRVRAVHRTVVQVEILVSGCGVALDLRFEWL